MRHTFHHIYHTSKPTHYEIYAKVLNLVHMYRVPLLTSASDTFEVYQNLRKKCSN